MSFLIGADFVPTSTNISLFREGNISELIGEDLVRIFSECDYKIFNLEVPLTDKASPIEKCGPALIAPTDTINGYKAIGVNCVTIANNHIMDQGVLGFESTVQTLEQNEIVCVGGGINLEEAVKPLVIENHGKKIGIYACAEHEFSIATSNNPGANPFEPLESLDHISVLKNVCDYVIVLYHGGKEHYRYPSPQLQKVCRKIVEKGADLVICQHSHCIGCEEKYKGGTIVYGQGNFLFDYSNSEFWQTGLLININDDFSISYIPLQKQGNGVRMAKGQSAEAIMDSFNRRSTEIQVDGAIESRYMEFTHQMREVYLAEFGNVNKKNMLFRIINKLSGYKFFNFIINKKFTQSKRLRLRNYIECEAHRELLLNCILK